jgi:hypothetical protein
MASAAPVIRADPRQRRGVVATPIAPPPSFVPRTPPARSAPGAAGSVPASPSPLPPVAPAASPRPSLVPQPVPGSVELGKELTTKATVTKEAAKELSRMFWGLQGFRTLVEDPRDQAALRRILSLGRHAARLLHLDRFPVLPQFRVSPTDVVVRDRSYQTYEYRMLGEFGTRLQGWVKLLATAIYADLLFFSPGKRRVHVRASLTRSGTWNGYFYAYGWDLVGRPWEIQGALDDVLVRDNGVPAGGRLRLMGRDHRGQVMLLNLPFPVAVQGEP